MSTALVDLGRTPTDVPIRQEYANLLLLKARVELAEDLPTAATVEAGRRHIRFATAANPSIALIPIVAAQIEGVAARAADGLEAARAAFEEGVIEARRAIHLQESNPNAHRTLAELLRWRAEWTFDQGGDPEPDVAAGLAALERTLELSAEIADAWALRSPSTTSGIGIGGGWPVDRATARSGGPTGRCGGPGRPYGGRSRG